MSTRPFLSWKNRRAIHLLIYSCIACSTRTVLTESIPFQVKPLPLASNLKARFDLRHLFHDSVGGILRPGRLFQVRKLNDQRCSVITESLHMYRSVPLCYLTVDCSRKFLQSLKGSGFNPVVCLTALFIRENAGGTGLLFWWLDHFSVSTLLSPTSRTRRVNLHKI